MNLDVISNVITCQWTEARDKSASMHPKHLCLIQPPLCKCCVTKTCSKTPSFTPVYCCYVNVQNKGDKIIQEGGMESTFY